MSAESLDFLRFFVHKHTKACIFENAHRFPLFFCGFTVGKNAKRAARKLQFGSSFPCGFSVFQGFAPRLYKLSEESLIKDLYILFAVRIQTRRSTLRSGSLFSLYLPVFISVNVSSRLGARLSGSALRCGAGRGASRCTLRMTGRFKYTVKRLKKKKIANGMKICRQVNSLMSSKTNLWKK